MNLRVDRNNKRPINPPMPSIHPKDKMITVSIVCKDQTILDELKVFKSALKELLRKQVGFIEMYKINTGKYLLLKVEEIVIIKCSKDEWED